MQTDGKCLLFVINPVSGGKEKNETQEQIEAYYRERQERAEFFELSGNDDRDALKASIEEKKPAVVVAVGGDGTIKLVAEIIRGSKTALGVIPAGSANGMAKELNIPDKVPPALDLITHTPARPIDLICINDSEYCIHLADVGLNAMLVKYFESNEGRGMWGYARSLLRVLWEKRKTRMKITTDDGELNRSAYMVVIANARRYGTGAQINPEGDVADGKFEVVILRKLHLLEIIKAVFTKRSFHPARIEVHATRRLKLASRRPVCFQVDGEYQGKTTEVHAQVLPAALLVITGPEQD